MSRPAAPRLLAGTSGFSYDAWKGPFYPEDLPARERLRFYAERLPAVEINNTFYRMPKASVLEGWAAQVPEGFRFAIKASRRITHQKRLRDVGEETGYLLRTSFVMPAPSFISFVSVEVGISRISSYQELVFSTNSSML